MGWWPGSRWQGAAIAGAGSRGPPPDRLNSIPVCVLYLDNQSWPGHPPPNSQSLGQPAPPPHGDGVGIQRLGQGASSAAASSCPSEADRGRSGCFSGICQGHHQVLSLLPSVSDFQLRPLQTKQRKGPSPLPSPTLKRFVLGLPACLAAAGIPQARGLRCGWERAARSFIRNVSSRNVRTTAVLCAPTPTPCPVPGSVKFWGNLVFCLLSFIFELKVCVCVHT